MDCKQGTALIIQQMTDLLRQLDNEVYTQALPVFNQSSIGQHFRHIINFYQCLLNTKTPNPVDYCQRERHTSIETECSTAISVLENIQQSVWHLPEDQPVMVLSDFSTDDDEQRTTIASSLGRELMYAYDHALHHLALVKIGLQVHFPNITLDPHLGVAPSTIKYQKKIAEASK